MDSDLFFFVSRGAVLIIGLYFFGLLGASAGRTVFEEESMLHRLWANVRQRLGLH